MLCRKCGIVIVALLLAAQLVQAASPVVMLLIDEKNLGSIPTSEVESTAIAALIERGVRTVDQEMVRANLQKEQALLKSVGDNRGAVALGLRFGADIVVVGEAVAKPSAERIAESKLRSYDAVVTLRAVRTDNAENIATASETATIIGVEDVSGGAKALRGAAEEAFAKLIPMMLGNWAASGASGGGRIVTLTVGGIDQTWKLAAVRTLLRNNDKLARNAVQKSYTAGAAVFEVRTFLPPEELAEKMILSAPEGLGFQVLDSTAATLDLRAVERR